MTSFPAAGSCLQRFSPLLNFGTFCCAVKLIHRTWCSSFFRIQDIDRGVAQIYDTASGLIGKQTKSLHTCQ